MIFRARGDGVLSIPNMKGVRTMDDCAQKRKEGQIGTGVNRLEIRVNELEKTIAVLHDRLMVAMTPEAPASTGEFLLKNEKADPGTENYSHLASGLEMINEKFVSCLGGLNQIISRLDL